MAGPLPGTSDRRPAHHSPDPEMAKGGWPGRRGRDGERGRNGSPLLANIYLFYVLDLYAEHWRRREASGDVIIVRYADDFIIGFEHETDAKRFLDLLRERMGKFALALHPEKTRLIEFGRHAAASRRQRGLGKPETFNFLGFTFICGTSRRGRFLIKRKSRRDRMRAKLQEIKHELRQRMHQPIREQGKSLKQVVGLSPARNDSGIDQLRQKLSPMASVQKIVLDAKALMRLVGLRWMNRRANVGTLQANLMS